MPSDCRAQASQFSQPDGRGQATKQRWTEPPSILFAACAEASGDAAVTMTSVRHAVSMVYSFHFLNEIHVDHDENQIAMVILRISR